MIVVIYDEKTGTILQTIQSAEANIKAMNLPYVEIDSPTDYDSTHIVVDGKIVEKPVTEADASSAASAK